MDPHTHRSLTKPPLPRRSDRRPDAPEVIRHWLATAHPTPERAYLEWSEQGVALLPLGRRFNAIRIPGRLIHAAAGSDAPDQVSRMLRDTLDGPVIHDHLSVGPAYYALGPHGRHIAWPGGNDTPLLSAGVYLGVPALERTTPPGTFWITPARYRNDLCRHDPVHRLINTGRRELRAIETASRDDDANTSPPEQS
ncbi:hypothetical protein [Streptomyces sp. NPDC050534]|uniref:hypothetical protein n=1 Tax=Streptomyces sp. NPDC050534 TaxID=3365625 RepID=UPI0037AD4D0A